MLEINGKQYELKFNLERLKLIEAAKKSSLMGEYYTTMVCSAFRLVSLYSSLPQKRLDQIHLSDRLMAQSFVNRLSCREDMPLLHWKSRMHLQKTCLFIPGQLIEYEYFQGEKETEEHRKMAKPYLEDMDFAFFVVNFGYTKKIIWHLLHVKRHLFTKPMKIRRLVHLP